VRAVRQPHFAAKDQGQGPGGAGNGTGGQWPDADVATGTSAVAWRVRRLLVQAGEEPANLVPGQGDHPAVVRVAAVRPGCGQNGQERAGEQGQDGPAVPGGPAADLVLVQGGEFLAGGEPVLDLSPGPPASLENRLADAVSVPVTDGRHVGARARVP
jgi:hypothetical protein